MPRSASLWMRFRQTMGRAFRETGQALERVGVRGQQLATAERRLVGDDPHIFDDHLSRHRHQMPLLERGTPRVSPHVAYLAPCSTLIGSVRIGAGSSVWYGAILRADSCENATNDDVEPWQLKDHRFVDGSHSVGGAIYIGENSNVQDGCIVTSRLSHTVIGNGVTIGHLAQIHSSTVKDNSLIGMGSVLLEGTVVEEEAFVAAGAVVPPKTTISSGELWVGNPARKLRDLTVDERAKLHYQASEYVKVATGQRGVMELGGNLPETLIQHLMLPGSDEEMKDEAANDSESSEAPQSVSLDQSIENKEQEEEEEEPQKAEGR